MLPTLNWQSPARRCGAPIYLSSPVLCILLEGGTDQQTAERERQTPSKKSSVRLINIRLSLWTVAAIHALFILTLNFSAPPCIRNLQPSWSRSSRPRGRCWTQLQLWKLSNKRKRFRFIESLHWFDTWNSANLFLGEHCSACENNCVKTLKKCEGMEKILVSAGNGLQCQQRDHCD